MKLSLIVSVLLLECVNSLFQTLLVLSCKLSEPKRRTLVFVRASVERKIRAEM